MPSPDELEDFARRGVAAQAAIDAINPMRPRAERVHHPELLEPIELPRLGEPQVIISMEDYRAYERFLDVFVSIENLIARGRLEARIEAYTMVLQQVELNDKLSVVRQPVLIESLQRIITACREDLARLEGATHVKAATPAGADLHEGRPAEQMIPHPVNERGLAPIAEREPFDRPFE